MRTGLSAALLSLAALLPVSMASAAPITTLYNTGVDASRTVLANGTIGDPHYALASVPATSTTDIRVITSAGGFPIPPYVPDNTTSAWIRPNNNVTAVLDDDPGGIYVWRTTFDLTGFDIGTAAIVGGWSTDNNGLKIVINGVDLNYKTTGVQPTMGFAPFTISTGFISGVNTLDFWVSNDIQQFPEPGNPTALRVEMTGTAEPLRVPEPNTLALLGLGLAGLAATRRRKQ